MNSNLKFIASSKPRAAQRGATLLEGIAFLGIAAVVILGAISLLVGAFSSANSNKIAEEVTAIRTGVKKLYMGQSSSYGTASLNTTLAAARVFPSTLNVNAGTGGVLNTWNGAVTITGANAQFTISYANVPNEVCITAVSAGGDWQGVSVNGNVLTLPVTPTAAQAQCNAGNNTVLWTAS
ncbi:MAG TPA: type 4 pilus major pilin [Noviherbaspirillum sp.]